MALVTCPARAQDTSRVAAATVLFDEGIRAMDAGHLDEACLKLVKSQELAPSGGTLLAIGDCYERSGRIASAWVAFREAASRAVAAGKVDAETNALGRAARLEPRLPRMTVRLKEPAKDIEVRRDGILLMPGELDIPTPIDPGRHTIRAKAPGAEEWTRAVDVTEAAPVVVDVPSLVPLTPVARRPDGAIPGGGDPGPSAPPSNEPGSGGTQRVIGLVVAGSGLLLLGVGAVFAVLARKTDDRAEEHCERQDIRRCTDQGLSLIDDAKSQALVSTVVVAVGATALAGGVVLVLTAPSRPKASSLRFTPTFTDSSAGGVATLRW